MDIASKENMTIDMLYHPKLAPIYHRYQICTFLFSTLIFGLSIYIILKKSTETMGIYKMSLINQIFWSYLVDLLIFIWQPIIMFPFYLSYSIGLAKHLGSNGSDVMFAVTGVFMWGLIHSTFFSLIFRVSRVYHESKLAKIFDNRWSLIKWAILTLGILELINAGKA